jgi:glutamate dehydrogenase
VSTTASQRGTTQPDGAESTPDPRGLLDAYLRHVNDEDVEARTKDDLIQMVASHLRLAQCRPQGTTLVTVTTPAPETDGWDAEGRTVVEVVTDDMPFLVDSVTAALSELDLVIDLVVHPILAVERSFTGELQRIAATDLIAGQVPPGAVRESWMHVEVERVTDPARREDVRSRLLGVLDDVRAAVEDWPRMRQRALDIVEELRAHPPELSPPPGGGSTGALSGIDELREGIDLLAWLADDHFTFLGYREYVLEELAVQDGGEPDLALRALPGTGLGLLRYDQVGTGAFGRLPPAVRAKAKEPHLMIITKANSRSTVHRPAYLDYVSVKVFDDSGVVVGERRFLGLFSTTAYTESIGRIPVLHRKSLAVLERLGYSPDSHSGKALLDICETYPRDELFQTSVDALAQTAAAVLHLQERRRVRLFVRPDDYGRFLSCLVYLPRDRYTTPVRLRMEAILASAVGGEASVDYTARVTESVLARLNFVVRPAANRLQSPEGFVDVDVAALERRLADAARSWGDQLVRAAHDLLDEAEATRRLATYGEAFPEAYKEDFGARTAVADLGLLEQVDPEIGIGLSLWSPGAAGPGEVRAKVFRSGSPLSLSQLLPAFTALGVEVVDERPYELVTADGRAWIYDIGLRASGTRAQEPAAVDGPQAELFSDTFLATWRGLSEADYFNRLVVPGSLTWRQVVVLRAYAAYLRQVRTPFSQRYIEDSLLANVDIARLVVELFEARFVPAPRPGGPVLAADDPARTERVEQLERDIVAALEAVSSLDEDRILRSYVALVRATVRTSFYQPDDAGQVRAHVAFKLLPRLLGDLAPAPRPAYEIFVYSPRAEGVHLRFGPVARGGLRWSDRREDFRTEVLGLVKAQMVKNTVIVPVGAKGGFYCKRLPDPALDRDAWLAEGQACYRGFVSALLDLTDNLVDGVVVPPRDVVRHDGDDSYLVVAADKGTATFSDLANEVAAEHDFWLGDAFASGGSAGYDHKAMGITARGAWESVRRHFREMGLDSQREDHTVVGVGDMSGDVFGNGMLLSQHTRLVAAFDHRHVFVDPDPDPAISYAERRRLFDLPRSSWADYDSALISEGGGVWPRTAKSVPVSPQVRRALGLGDGEEDGGEVGSATSMTPAQLMHAILQAPVDLLWNGGIGTYVKASTETDAEVGDKANDAIRVDGADLRVRCVGEGGNLGLTQRGRIEYARNGGRINTDFIDNSAGVDTSDHEVNIKILLDRVVREERSDLDRAGRDALLASMTDEVAELVLADNDAQNRALANALEVAPALLHVHADWMRQLEREGHLVRSLEALPTVKEIAARRAEGTGLTAPELAVLLAYTKMVAANELLASDLPDDPLFRGRLYSYFPTPMRQGLRAAMDAHPLRRQIIVTQVVNEMVNSAGSTFASRLSGETGASLPELTRAHAIATEIFGATNVRRTVDALDNEVDAAVVTQMRLAVRTLVERATRWLVDNRRHLDTEAAVDHFDPLVQQVVRALPEVLVGRELDALSARAEELVDRGVPSEVAQQVAATPAAFSALSIVDTARRIGTDVFEVARVHAALSERLEVDRLVDRIVALPRNDRWQTMARATLRGELQEVHARLAAEVLERTDVAAPEAPPDVAPDAAARVEQWVQDNGPALKRAQATLTEVLADDAPDLAQMSVALRVVRSLLS